MARVVASLFTSLDGVTADPQTWHFPWLDARMLEIVQGQYDRAGTLLLGRRTYESCASSWGFRPADTPLARRIRDLPRLVASRTLHDAPWPGSTLVADDLEERVSELRAADGGDVLVTGSVGLVRWLLRAGLLDELQLLVHPVVVGSGDRLLDERLGPVTLRLVDSEVLGTGVTVATYAPAA